MFFRLHRFASRFFTSSDKFVFARAPPAHCEKPERVLRSMAIAEDGRSHFATEGGDCGGRDSKWTKLRRPASAAGPRQRKIMRKVKCYGWTAISELFATRSHSSFLPELPRVVAPRARAVDRCPAGALPGTDGTEATDGPLAEMELGGRVYWGGRCRARAAKRARVMRSRRPPSFIYETVAETHRGVVDDLGFGVGEKSFVAAVRRDKTFRRRMRPARRMAGISHLCFISRISFTRQKVVIHTCHSGF